MCIPKGGNDTIPPPPCRDTFQPIPDQAYAFRIRPDVIRTASPMSVSA